MDSISGNATPITSNTTILAVREGESFVLECNPRTNDPSISAVSAVWTRDDHFLINSGDEDGITFLGERNSTLLIRNLFFFWSGERERNISVSVRWTEVSETTTREKVYHHSRQRSVSPLSFVCAVVVALWAGVGAQMSS